MQVLGTIPLVFGIRFPPAFQDLLNILAFWDPDLPDFGCELVLDYHTKLLLRTLVPIGLLAVLGLIERCTTRLAPDAAATPKLRIFCGNAAFAIIFLCYAGCTAAVFSTFNCEAFDNGASYLKADYSIDCDSDTHQSYKHFASAMFIWPGGVPILYACLFYAFHGLIVASDHYAPEQQARRRSSRAGGGAKSEGSAQQEADMFSSISELATGGDMAGKRAKGLPTGVAALISPYELKFYW